MTERRIRVVLFDVNETLSDLTPLQDRFEQVGAPPQLMRVWFAGVLRDGIALATVGEYASFRDVADSVLRDLLTQLTDWDGEPAAAAEQILAGFAELDVHPDVPDGVRRMHAAGLRLATLTNGSTNVSRELLGRAGVRDAFDALLDVEAAGAWKPAPAAYDYALAQLHADPAETLLVAVHPWDITGARHAGLQAAWLQRGAHQYPRVMAQPDLIAQDLRELADLLTRG